MATGQGSATIDFGTGKMDTSLAVTGQASILTTHLVEAWLSGASTADNLQDAGFAENMLVFGGDIVDATGFTIYAQCQRGRCFGKYVINWVWA